MASKHKITQTKPLFGQSRSKAFNTSKRSFQPNMQTKRIFVPELGKSVRVRLTAAELKTVDKIGLREYMKRLGRTVESLL